jgi:hypothetical protein
MLEEQDRDLTSVNNYYHLNAQINHYISKLFSSGSSKQNLLQTIPSLIWLTI